MSQIQEYKQADCHGHAHGKKKGVRFKDVEEEEEENALYMQRLSEFEIVTKASVSLTEPPKKSESNHSNGDTRI
eukprot:UN03003